MTQTAPILAVRSTDTPRAQASHLRSGVLIAVISALAFASSGPLMKPLLESGWSVSAVLAIRMGLSGLILSPAIVRAVQRHPGFLRRHGLLVLGFGFIPVAGCQIFYFSAMQRMPVAVALLIQYLAPVFLVLWVWARTRRAPALLVIVGAAVSVAGLVMVVDIGGARFDVLGTLFALGAALCVCAYFVMSERASHDLSPLALAGGGLLVGAATMVILGLTGLMPFAVGAPTVTFQDAQVPSWLPLLWVGGVGTTLGYALGVLAVPRIGSRLASFVGLSEVLFALMFGWLLLGEAPGLWQLVGGVLIVAGVIAIRRDAGSQSPR